MWTVRPRAAALYGVALPLLLPWLLVGCDAPAGAGGDPVGATARPERIASGALNIVGGDIVLPGAAERAAPPPGVALGQSGRHVLFLNFEGADVRDGNNAMENEGLRSQSITTPVVPMEPFAPQDAKRYDSILQVQKLVAGYYADINVDVVISRPLSGDYMMTVVGGRQSDIGLPDGVVGISRGDCGNTRETDLNYAFSASLSQNVQQVAVTAAHEAGHAYGLSHTDNKKDIMYPSVQPSEGFQAGTIPNSDCDRTGACGVCGLPPGSRQDSKQVLLDNLGARDGERPGAARPTVKFLSPADLTDAPSGTDVGGKVVVAVQAAAPAGKILDRVSVIVNVLDGGKVRGGHAVAELRPPVSSARLMFSTPGDYQILAVAYDNVGNLNLAQSKIHVATSTCLVPNDCAPGQRCTGGACVTPPMKTMVQGDMGGVTVPRDYGSACVRSDECQGGICAPTPVGQICTHYCTPGRACAGNLECVDGVCQPLQYQVDPPKATQLGSKCRLVNGRDADCGIGLHCVVTEGDAKNGTGYCTRDCDAAVAWSCPAEMVCAAPGSGSDAKSTSCLVPAAMPPVMNSGGGCSAGGGRAGAGAVPVLLLGALWLLRRRQGLTGRVV